jgi:hypothetical protein
MGIIQADREESCQSWFIDTAFGSEIDEEGEQKKVYTIDTRYIPRDYHEKWGTVITTLGRRQWDEWRRKG